MALVVGCSTIETEPEANSSGTESEFFDINEATIASLTDAMESGTLTSVELTAIYLNRIATYDAGGINLNSVNVMNEQALDDAARMDELRAEGTILGPMHGIPFTVKDSYKVDGLTVASGSPAFAGLRADEDAFTVEKIREAGGIVLGKTNMPPMANGGMQRGEYGRAESPYSSEYLTAAWGSGSSNGSGTSTAANFATFGMGEETVSSGRSPASNNGLVAYTPSRGVVSIRGNWPLWPTRDVVVPHTRSVEDTLAVLDVVASRDERPEGDFWLTQPFIEIPDIDDVRPESYDDLKQTDSLEGKRIGVPRMYLNKDDESETPIATRQSVIDLWDNTAQELSELGAEVVEVDFPLVENFFEDRPGAESMYTRGYVAEEWEALERGDLASFWMEQFLASNEDPSYTSFGDVDPATIFPNPSRLPADPAATTKSWQTRIDAIVDRMPEDIFTMDGLGDALAGYDRTREEDFDSWLAANDLDLLAFPAVADIAAQDSDINIEANEHAQSYGVGRSATDHVMRQFGIPSVSVPMGLVDDIDMPMNVTFAGLPYSDNELLSYAFAYEQATHHRPLPVRTPALDTDRVEIVDDETRRPETRQDTDAPELSVVTRDVDRGGLTPRVEVTVTSSDPSGIADLWLTANGDRISLVEANQGTYEATVLLDRYTSAGDAGPVDGIRLVTLSKDRAGNASADTRVLPTR
ncbi:amidase [Rhodococcoides kyotonense]|uniref:amidase n=1 Tax=Rhodococcoides kyotonense TaxID=398843 RepID=UPI000B791BB1|nr:amidase [Rhodococcus kyotonensis]